MNFKVLYTIEAPWPSDRPNPDRLDAMEWRRPGRTIPLVPSVGMMIDCGDGEYRRVRCVYWAAGEPGKIEVNFDDCDDGWTLGYWRDGGWEPNA